MKKPQSRKHNIGKDYLDLDDIFYIKHHLAAGITKERIAAAVYCDLEDVEQVEKRWMIQSAS